MIAKLLSYIVRNAIGIIEVFLLARLALKALSANGDTTVVAFVYHWTDWLLQPVSLIFSNIPVVGNATIDTVAIAGMVFYGIVYFIFDRILHLLFLSE